MHQKTTRVEICDMCTRSISTRVEICDMCTRTIFPALNKIFFTKTYRVYKIKCVEQDAFYEDM